MIEDLRKLEESLAETKYLQGKVEEFLRDLMPQLADPQLEWLHTQIEVELRERDEEREKAFGLRPF